MVLFSFLVKMIEISGKERGGKIFLRTKTIGFRGDEAVKGGRIGKVKYE